MGSLDDDTLESVLSDTSSFEDLTEDPSEEELLSDSTDELEDPIEDDLSLVKGLIIQQTLPPPMRKKKNSPKRVSPRAAEKRKPSPKAFDLVQQDKWETAEEFSSRSSIARILYETYPRKLSLEECVLYSRMITQKVKYGLRYPPAIEKTLHSIGI